MKPPRLKRPNQRVEGGVRHAHLWWLILAMSTGLVTPCLAQDEEQGKFDMMVRADSLPEVLARVEPHYPDSARARGVTGTVVIEVHVGKDGHVQGTTVVKSIPMLDGAATAAVRQWLFRPAVGNGNPVAWWLPVSIAFPPAAPGTHARFERLATLNWHLPYCPAGGSPWSPAGGLLAVDSAGRLGVFDVQRPDLPLRTLLAMATSTNITVSWSPDGRWIACKTKTYSRRRADRGIAIGDSLWVVPVEGGRPELVRGGSEFWPFFWASDGYIYGWDGSKACRLAPPAAWRAQNLGAVSRISRLASAGNLGIVRITPGDPPTVVALPQLGRALQRGAFPDAERFLMILSPPGPRNVIVDAAGAIRGVLDGSAREDSSSTALDYFTATSVTADNRYVMGFYEVDDARGDDIAKAVVFLADTLGGVRIPIEGACYSTKPELSPAGPWLVL